jgi:hypothetical protein
MSEDHDQRRWHLRSIRLFIATYQHHISVAAFLAGFVLDNLALPPIDHPASHIIIAFYLMLAAAGIVLIQVMEGRQSGVGLIARTLLFVPLVIQVIFGGLFSSLFVFYARSASLSGAWPFMLMLIIMIIGNEVLRDRYARLEFQMSVLFTTLFGFMIFYLPILFSRLDDLIFLMSGVVSLLVTALFGSILFVVAPHAMRLSAGVITLTIGGIFALFNLLYFTNSIPPIPLALRSADVYHSVLRDAEGSYVGQTEKASWYERHIAFSPPYHYGSNESVYFYSAVFAPTALKTPIYHEWQYFDETKGEWLTSMRVSFPIFGGRENGYRGYSTKSAIAPGRWRVLVKTERGALLGKTAFTVVAVSSSVFLEEKVL